MKTLSQQFSITLPDDLAAMVERKIESGAYASVNDMILDGVRGLLEQEATLERWLQTEIREGHADYMVDPSKGIPAHDILDRIKKRRATNPTF